ncbi:MAG: ABC transporter permease [Oscillospiraceae bacterium]|nr:ABC transporter permease [Oscillospiraceae bacterium]
MRAARRGSIAAKLAKPQALAAPYVLWLAVFVAAPILIIAVFAFVRNGGGFTLSHFAEAARSWKVFGRSFWLAFVATAICLLLGYPLAYVLSRESANVQRVMSMLIMLPMWMNFLLRTYAWMSILEENNGLLNRLLGFLRLPQLHIANSPTAVVIGMVYNFLPFMVLPLYSVLVKLDKRLVEAAQDLGATPVQVFRRVTFRLSLPGVISGVTMVFVPAVSTFAISKLLGGGKSDLLGDLIERNFLSNKPFGSAISLLMMVICMVFIGLMNKFGDGGEGTLAI